MKPYPQSGLTNERRIYNYRLSRNRRISENAFGIMANRWRILRSPIPLCPEKVSQIILALITLHNFLLKHPESSNNYVPPHLVDVEDEVTGCITPGMWRNDPSSSSWLTYNPTVATSIVLMQKPSGRSLPNTSTMRGQSIGNGDNVGLIRLFTFVKPLP